MILFWCAVQKSIVRALSWMLLVSSAMSVSWKGGREGLGSVRLHMLSAHCITALRGFLI